MDIYTTSDQLLNFTQAMLAAATSDDWDMFSLQEQQRRTMLEMVFSDKIVEESDQLHLAVVINKILLIDQDITCLIIEQRNQAAEELRLLIRANVGNKAYRIAADSE